MLKMHYTIISSWFHWIDKLYVHCKFLDSQDWEEVILTFFLFPIKIKASSSVAIGWTLIQKSEYYKHLKLGTANCDNRIDQFGEKNCSLYSNSKNLLLFRFIYHIEWFSCRLYYVTKHFKVTNFPTDPLLFYSEIVRE